MIHKFITYKLDEDGHSKTQTVNGQEEIVVSFEREYTYEEMLDIAASAHETERERFGWSVKFDDGEHKSIFIRSSHIESCNDTTRSDQTLIEWIDHIYGRSAKQIDLF